MFGFVVVSIFSRTNAKVNVFFETAKKGKTIFVKNFERSKFLFGVDFLKYGALLILKSHARFFPAGFVCQPKFEKAVAKFIHDEER